MSTEQLELPAPAVASSRMDGRDAHARELEQMLRTRGRLTCQQIEGLRPDWHRKDGRYVRVLASHSGRIVSAPGTAGYLLADDSTIEDADVDEALREAANLTISQMREMGKKVRHFRALLGIRAALRTRLSSTPQ